MILAGEKISAPKAAGETEAGAEGGELTRHIRFARDACRGGGRTRRAWIRQTRGTISSRVGVDTRRVNLRRGGLSTTRATRLPVHLSRGRMNHNPRPETGNGGSEATLPAVPTVVAAGNKEFPTKTEGENARRLARDALATSATRGAPFPGALESIFYRALPEKPRGERYPVDVRLPAPRGLADRRRRAPAIDIASNTRGHVARHRFAVLRRGRRVAAIRFRAGLGATFCSHPLHDFKKG